MTSKFDMVDFRGPKTMSEKKALRLKRLVELNSYQKKWVMLMFFVHVVDVHVDLNVVDVNLNIDSAFEVVDVNDVDCIIDVLAGVVVWRCCCSLDTNEAAKPKPITEWATHCGRIISYSPKTIAT